MTTCNVRQPDGVWRCERERGHSGDHDTLVGSVEVKQNRITWPNEREPKAKAQRKQSRLPRTSQASRRVEPKAVLDAKWAGIKEGMIEMARRLDPDGPRCESCGVKGTEKTLDLHHLRRRGQGGEYSGRNASLLCNRFHEAGHDCHGTETGKLEWTKGATA